MKLFDFLLDLLFPRKCVLCQKLLSRQETDLCHHCRTYTQPHGEPYFSISFLAQWRCVWYYEDKVRESLLRYKFSGRRSYAQAYGRLLAVKLLPIAEEIDLITWVPISARRKHGRGYDQVELLAKAVADELGIPALPLIKKIRHNPAQSGIQGKAQRKANVLGAYRAQNSDALQGKHILLLDDIITTGSTLSECARVLLTAGAKTISGGAIAARHNDPKESKHQ